MGALCSCLGKRPSSQDDDLDRILNSDQPTYGTTDYEGLSPRDEEEFRRERDALEQITARAADHMIDIIHPSQADLNQGLVHSAKHHGPQADATYAEPSQGQEEDDAEEAAWFRDLGEDELDIQVPQRGNLVMDINLLRDTQQQRTQAAVL